MNMVQKRGFASLTSREGGAIPTLGKIAAFVFLAFTFVCFLSASAGAQVSVLTQHADTERDGVYSNETHLTPTSTTNRPYASLLSGHLTLTYTRAIAAVDVSLVIEQSNDLVTWQSDPSYIQHVSCVDEGPIQRITVQLTTPVAGASVGYLRLRVTRL